MPKLRLVAWILLFAVSASLAAAGDEYPARPVRILAGEPGGINDITTRMIAQGLTAGLGQQVIVDNRGGAGGAVAGEIVARAAPDGYTLISYGSSLWLAPFLRDGVSYDPVRDFAPITLAVSSPVVLVVNPSVPANSTAQLIALAKAKPGTLNYGSGGAGTTPHLAMELFKSKAGVNIVRIPYKGAGPALSDMLTGQLQVMIVTAGSATPHLKSGKLKGLAVGSTTPSPLAPGLPTVAASGLPGYEFTSMWAIFGPAKTPAPVIQRLSRESARVLSRPEIKEKFMNAGADAVGSTPERLAAAVKGEMTTLGKLIKTLGIRSD